MEYFVTFSQTTKDRNGIFHSWLIHHNRLKPAFQGRIFFDVFAVFGKRRCADDLNFAARQRRLQNIGGVHGAFGIARADKVVNLIDDKNDVAAGLDLGDEALHAALELATELRSGDERRQVEQIDLFVAQLEREGCRALAVQADVSKRDEVNAMVKRVEEAFGPISVLVNNAGVAGQALFQDVTDALWERYFAVNLNGARNTIQAVLPHMLHKKAGVIVNISSIWGQHGASCEVTYSCTKHALIGLTRSLAMELAPSGIRVNCVAPGVIDTDMVQVLGPEVLHDLAEQTPLGRLGTPQDIANAVAFLVSEKASFITGQVLTVDGAFVG